MTKHILYPSYQWYEVGGYKLSDRLIDFDGWIQMPDRITEYQKNKHANLLTLIPWNTFELYY